MNNSNKIVKSRLNRRYIKLIAIIIGSLLLIPTALLFIRYNNGKKAYQELIEVREKLHVGMTREETEILTKGTDRHRICDYDEFSLSLFYFGESDDYSVLLLTFDKIDGQEILRQVSQPEPYLLRAEPYVSCQLMIP